MKKIYIMLLLLLPMFLIGCSTKSLVPNTDVTNTSGTNNNEELIENPKTRGYENKVEKFAFDFENGREFEENKYGFNTIVFAPQDDDIKENVGISVQHLQKFLSIQEYYEETIASLKNTLTDFKEKKAENINQNGLEGKQMIYEYKEGDTVLNSQQTFLMGNNNTVYIINYTATKKTFNKFIDGVNTIIESFTIIE